MRKIKQKRIEIISATGEIIIGITRKYIPRNCKAPKRICIKCQVNIIRKNDRRYDTRICKECALNINKKE